MRIAVIMVMGLTFLTGCAGNRLVVEKTVVPARQDVFQPVQSAEIPPGKALLLIDFPVKAYRSRILNSYLKHSAPPYTARVTIDGQTVELSDDPVLEELAGKNEENPEAGTGWKYTFRSRLLLTPGKHQVTVSVPLAGVQTEKELTLDKVENVLRIRPVYNSSVSRHPGYTGFEHGLRTLILQLNPRQQ